MLVFETPLNLGGTVTCINISTKDSVSIFSTLKIWKLFLPFSLNILFFFHRAFFM